MCHANLTNTNEKWAIQGSNPCKTAVTGLQAGFDAQNYAQAVDLPADLRRVIEAWPKLPASLRAAVLAVVDSAGKDNG